MKFHPRSLFQRRRTICFVLSIAVLNVLWASQFLNPGHNYNTENPKLERNPMHHHSDPQPQRSKTNHRDAVNVKSKHVSTTNEAPNFSPDTSGAAGATQQHRHPPRVFALFETITSQTTTPPLHTRNIIQQYSTTTEPTDPTQLYPIIDSNDERYFSNKIPTPQFPINRWEPDQCVPYSEWQTSSHPTCNDFHELDIVARFKMKSMQLVSTNGYWRNAWRVDDEGGLTDFVFGRSSSNSGDGEEGEESKVGKEEEEEERKTNENNLNVKSVGTLMPVVLKTLK